MQAVEQIGENYPAKSNSLSFLPLLSQGKKTIVIEGFNKEGKSTLAQALSETLQMESIQFPLKLPETKDTVNYARVMLDIRDRLEDKIIERYGLTLVTYYNILHIEDLAEDLLKFMRDNTVVITSTSFWNTAQFALRDYPDLKKIARDLRVILLHPHLLRKPDYLETISMMNNAESIWYIRNKLSQNGLMLYL